MVAACGKSGVAPDSVDLLDVKVVEEADALSEPLQQVEAPDSPPP